MKNMQFTRDALTERSADRTMPTRRIHHGMPYIPSWLMVPRTTWTNKLSGHYGLVGPYQVKQGDTA